MVILGFDGLTKSVRSDRSVARRVVRRARREIFGLLGPNGAGKSTLIRILMDIIRPNRGSVRVFGEPWRREHLDRLGYLPEERGLYTQAARARRDDLLRHAQGPEPRAGAHTRREWLARVELPHVATWKVERLSKGMRQKVQIASMLMTDPELCVLDEPTTASTRSTSPRAGPALRAQAVGRTTILSTHHMNQVESLCDRVALINKGRLVVYGRSTR